MAASSDTVKEVAEIVRRHVDSAMIKAIVRDLVEVRGNQSFRETISKLVTELERR